MLNIHQEIFGPPPDTYVTGSVVVEPGGRYEFVLGESEFSAGIKKGIIDDVIPIPDNPGFVCVGLLLLDPGEQEEDHQDEIEWIEIEAGSIIKVAEPIIDEEKSSGLSRNSKVAIIVVGLVVLTAVGIRVRKGIQRRRQS